MSITREKIRLTDNDIKIKFSLSQNNEFTGLKQEIDKLTQFNTLDVVNPAVDGEKTRFRFNSTSTGTLSFEFFNENLSIFLDTLPSAGFNFFEEVLRRTPNVQNSFFIMDYYDSFNTYNQTKIFSSYLTKIVFGREVLEQAASSYELFNDRIQLNTIAVPNWYIESQPQNIITGYTKFYFYNAKTGRVVPFFNLDNQSLSTPERFYFRTEIFKSSKQWRFVSASMPTFIAREVRENINPQFVNKINDTNTNFDNLRLDFPTGNTFDDETGTYVIT